MAFLGFGLVMTQSRAAWLFILLIIALRAGLRHRIAWRTSATAVGVAALMFVGAVAVWAPLNDVIGVGVGALPLTERMQPGLRAIHWVSMFDALKRSPITGYGITCCST
jgi:O-antigen ligase